MGAVFAAMGGAVGGAIINSRLQEKINQTFKSDEMRQQAQIVLKIFSDNAMNKLLIIPVLCLGVPLITIGIIWLEKNYGHMEVLIGILLGLGLLIRVHFFLNKYFLHLVRKKIRKFIKEYPQGEYVVKNVRKMLSEL